MAAQLYDEIPFNGATFGDGPFIIASATDIASGARVPFNQNIFNVLCSDLNAVRLVPRHRGIVCRPCRAVSRHDQQVRRHLQFIPFDPGRRCLLDLSIRHGLRRARHAS